MKRLIGLTILGLFLASTALGAAPGDQGKGKKNEKRDDAQVSRSGGQVDVHVTFGRGEVVLLRDHYAPRYRNLPPGLQKKLARGGELPPGWQKRFEPFPVAVERRLPVLPAGYRRGIIDGHAVIFSSRTNLIVDIAVLF
jgi:hypothetical protein